MCMCATYVCMRPRSYVCVHQAQFVTYVCVCVAHISASYASNRSGQCCTADQVCNVTCIHVFVSQMCETNTRICEANSGFTRICETNSGFRYVHVSHICVSHLTCMCLRHSLRHSCVSHIHTCVSHIQVCVSHIHTCVSNIHTCVSHTHPTCQVILHRSSPVRRLCVPHIHLYASHMYAV